MRILDTDVCLEVLRGNRAVLERRLALEDTVAATWMTAAELYYGAERSRAQASNRVAVTDLLATLSLAEPTLAVAQHFGRLKARLEQDGEALADADILIASHCLAHGAVLVTGNVRHFSRVPGLQVEDWIRG